MITWQILLAALGGAGTVFTIYKNYFSAPDEKAATNDAVLTVQLAALTTRLDKVLTNDLPHQDQKIETIRASIEGLGKEMVRLATIIEERIPKR